MLNTAFPQYDTPSKFKKPRNEASQTLILSLLLPLYFRGATFSLSSSEYDLRVVPAHGGTGNAASIFLRPRTGRAWQTDRDSGDEGEGEEVNRKASSDSAYEYEKFRTRHWMDGDGDDMGESEFGYPE